jgi:hypothetical protein
MCGTQVLEYRHDSWVIVGVRSLMQSTRGDALSEYCETYVVPLHFVRDQRAFAADMILPWPEARCPATANSGSECTDRTKE